MKTIRIRDGSTLYEYVDSLEDVPRVWRSLRCGTPLEEVPFERLPPKVLNDLMNALNDDNSP